MNFKTLILIFVTFLFCKQGFSQHDNEEPFLTGFRTYKYDDKGLRTEKLSYDKDSILRMFVHYRYDEAGNKIETLKYSADSILISHNIYFYENNIKVKSEGRDYKRNYITTYLFYYDENNNVSKIKVLGQKNDFTDE